MQLALSALWQTISFVVKTQKIEKNIRWEMKNKYGRSKKSSYYL